MPEFRVGGACDVGDRVGANIGLLTCADGEKAGPFGFGVLSATVEKTTR